MQKQDIELRVLRSNVRDDFDALSAAMRKQLQSRVVNHVHNLTDLDEFAQLDPYIKDMYKKNIVDKLMPAVMQAVNNQIVSNKRNGIVELNEKEITDFVDVLTRSFINNGLDTIPKAIALSSDAGVPVVDK